MTTPMWAGAKLNSRQVYHHYANQYQGMVTIADYVWEDLQHTPLSWDFLQIIAFQMGDIRLYFDKSRGQKFDFSRKVKSIFECDFSHEERRAMLVTALIRNRTKNLEPHLDFIVFKEFVLAEIPLSGFLYYSLIKYSNSWQELTELEQLKNALHQNSSKSS